MSYTEALQRALTLKAALLDHGVRAVSIELRQGRPGTPNDAWWDSRFMSSFVHHTVSRPSNGNTPCLALVKVGRSDVPGPLCNGYGGFDEIARIICMGWANHPGYGGPLALPGGVIPLDNARPYAFGWEFEGGLEAWSESMHVFMARCSAGTLDWLGRGVDSQAEHKTWAPTRKIDRLNYSTASGRARTARHWNDGNYLPPAPEDDMPYSVAQLEKIVADNCSRAIQAWVAGGINQQFDSKEITAIKGLDPANGVLGELIADVREIKASLAALTAKHTA